MKTVAVAALLLVATFGSAEAQAEWREQLRSEQVEISGGKYTFVRTGVMTLALPGQPETTLQYQINSEAPASGVISRDNFIATTAQISTLMMIMALPAAAEVPIGLFAQFLDIEVTDELIGKPDIRLNIYMTAEGMQIEFAGPDGKPYRITQTWEQVYEEY